MAIYDGSYAGTPVYGVVPHEPMAMDVTVVDGVITRLAVVYLP